MAEQVGAELTNFVMNPADLLTLATAKVANDWQQPLLGIDPSSPTRRSAQGVPIQLEPGGPRGHHLGCPAGESLLCVALAGLRRNRPQCLLQFRSLGSQSNNSLGLRLPASAGRRQRSVSAAHSQPVRAVALGQVPAQAATPAPSLPGPVAASFPRRGRANHRRTNEAHRWHAATGSPGPNQAPAQAIPNGDGCGVESSTATAYAAKSEHRAASASPTRSTTACQCSAAAWTPRRMRRVFARVVIERNRRRRLLRPARSHHASGLRRAPSRRARGDLGTVTGNPPRRGSPQAGHNPQPDCIGPDGLCNSRSL